MDLFLSKLLPVAVYPLGLAILLAILALVLSFTRLRRLGRGVLLVAIMVLYVASMPVFANWLTYELESQYPPVPIEAAASADVAILLGGVIGQPLPAPIEADLSSTIDRVAHAARLYNAGKVGAILVTAGNLPWEGAVRPEAELIADFLAELGVPREAIVLETASRNTHENAIYSATIFRQRGWDSALLVTSALHMPRAMAVFEKEGLPVVASSTDARSPGARPESILDFLPDAGAIGSSTDAIKEFVGLIAYRIRGWA